MTRLQSFIGKVWKGALAGGAASVGMALASGMTVSSLVELKSLVTLVVSAFLTGAILGVIKMATWVE